MTQPAERVAADYIAAVSAHDVTALTVLLDDALEATFAGGVFGKEAWLAALQRLMPALLRNDILEIFVAGERVCVVYDFVTDTPAGAVRCVELLTVIGGQITAVELILDRVAFGPVNAALAERASAS